MKSDNTFERLIGGRLIARNVAFNIIGQVVPLGAAVFAIPILIRGLGTERFGVLSLAWMVIGYFSLLDLGIGRALTKSVAEKLGASKEKKIPGLIWTGLLIVAAMGVIGALLIGLISRWLVFDALKIPYGLLGESLQSFYLVAIITPIVILSIGFRGVLEAHQRFGIINAVRINMGIFSFLGPLLVLPFSQSLLAIIAVLAVGRVVECLLMFMICVRLTPELRRGIVIQWGVVWSLLRYGGWVTISSTLGPIMIYCDRFLIGILISMAAVAYYVTPYELVTKLWFIPNAMTGVLFPAFSVSYHRDANRAGKLFSFGLRCLFLAFFPIALLITSLGQEGLNLWLGKEFAMRSTRVLQWLTIAVFVNSMAHIPFALIQGAGRPDLTAKLHLLEVPFYLIAVWLMIGAYGIEGAAIVWFGRALIDTLILLKIAGWLLPKTSHFIRQTSITMCVAILTLAVPMLHIERFTRMIFPFMALPIFAFFMWFYFLEPEERVFTQNFLGGQIRIVNNWIGKK